VSSGNIRRECIRCIGQQQLSVLRVLDVEGPRPHAVPSARPTIHRRLESLAIKPDEQRLWRLLRSHVANGHGNLTPDVICTS
jgi:hypothetical protein